MVDFGANDDFVRRIRRTLGLETYDAILTGTTNSTTGTLGNVTYSETVDNEGLPTALHFAPGFGIPTLRNLAVEVRYDAKSRQYLIYPPNVAAAAAQNINIDILNPSASTNDVSDRVVSQTAISSLMVVPTSPASDEIVVAPFAYRIYGDERTFPGALTGSTDDTGTHDSFAALIPSAGEHRIIGIFLRTDHTLQCVGSTARSTADPIDAVGQADLTDFQECLDGADPGAFGVAYYYVTGDTTAVETKPTRDGRQIVDAEDIAPMASVPFVIRHPSYVPDERVVTWTVTATNLSTLQIDGQAVFL